MASETLWCPQTNCEPMPTKSPQLSHTISELADSPYLSEDRADEAVKPDQIGQDYQVIFRLSIHLFNKSSGSILLVHLPMIQRLGLGLR